MAISLKDVKRGTVDLPPRILLFGPEGIGKTSFGALAPNPIFIMPEDGIGLLDFPRFPEVKSWQDVLDCFNALASEEHEYDTLVIDTLDWMEQLIWKQVCANEGVAAIEQIPYGKGYELAYDIWRDQYLDAVQFLSKERKMIVVQLAHAAIRGFNSPETDSYDRYDIKLHRNKKDHGAASLVMERNDVVLFANYRTTVSEEKTGGMQTRKRGVGGGTRMLYAEERPAFRAKNRYNMPQSFPLDGNAWTVLAQHVPYLKKFLPDNPPPPIDGAAAVAGEHP